MRSSLRISKLLSGFRIAKSTFYSRHTKQEARDQESYKIIKKHYDLSKGKEGIRQLSMTIERKERMRFNKKRIARIKLKFNLPTLIRRKNVYRVFAKKKIEHEIFPNLLERNFKNLDADQVYCTDITELKYGDRKAYLAAVKDLGTRAIMSYVVSNRIDINLTNSAIEQALLKASPKKKESLMIHSDQGFHFTHVSFRKKVETAGAFQSMSRKGNCLDNAPMESFFGLFKDHLDLSSCKTIEEVKNEVQKTMNYYNYCRPQVGLKKMPPMEYRRQMLSPGFF